MPRDYQANAWSKELDENVELNDSDYSNTQHDFVLDSLPYLHNINKEN
jgi:hypothetical protein